MARGDEPPVGGSRRRRTTSPEEVRSRQSQEWVNGTKADADILPTPRRAPNPFEAFTTGNIVQLRMRSFLTFSDSVLEPGPRLNLILGPNGTGKSSVVSAVCIVFGGQLNLLGRSADLSAYVRHGHTDAEVEAFLFDPAASGGVRRVSRAFSRDSGRSTYRIDGEKASATDIDAVKKRYDIQLDNLSQFMPQEKIADFVQQTPVDLLTSTIRALGGTQKLERYQELMDLDMKCAGFEGQLAAKEKSLAVLVADCEGLEAEVEAYRQYQKVRQLIRDMRRFLPWAQHSELQDMFVNAKTQFMEAEVILVEKREEANALQGPLAQIEHRRDAAWNRYHNDAKKAVREKNNIVDDYRTRAEKLSDILIDLKQRVAGIDKQLERRQRTISLARERLEGEKKKLASALASGNDASDTASQDDLTARRSVVRQELSATSSKLHEAVAVERDVKHDIHRLHERNKALGDVRTRRIRALDAGRQHSGVAQIAEWVANNESLFRFQVFGPIAAEVDCKTEFAACALVQLLSGFALGAFVVQCKADGDVLRREASARFGRPPAILTPGLNADGVFDAHAILETDYPVDDHLHSLGIDAVVSDTFNAPPAVKAVLVAQHNLHRVYVGNERAEQCMEQLVSERHVNLWMTPNNTYNCVSSRYNPNSRSTAVVDTNKVPGVLSGRMDDSEKKSLLDALGREEEKLMSAVDAKRDLEERMTTLTQKEKGMTADVRLLMERIQSRKTLRARVSTEEMHLKRALSDNAQNEALAEKKVVLRKLSTKEKESVELCEELVESMRAVLLALAKRDEVLAEYTSVDRELTTEKQKHGDTDRELKEMEESVQLKKDDVKKRRGELRAKMREAEKSLPEEKYLENEDYYKEFGFDSEKLSDDIQKKEEEAKAMTGGGSGVIEKYDQKKKSAAELEVQIQTMKDAHGTRQQQFDRDKQSFIEWLTSCVSRMATRFSALYQGFDCRGDIQLINERSRRLKDMAIQILVSYRDDVDLQPISPQGNSGGEKMACTMLYCFSLQAMEKTPPFIMVDELNQGLDPKNERYIMKIMLDEAEKGTAPQSFVVTPKLLVDLPVRSATVTHIIMNGSICLPMLAPAKGQRRGS